MSKICIKILKDNNQNKYLMFVKKFIGEGISNIKSKIDNDQYVATFDSFDEDNKIKEFIQGIEKLGGTVKLFEEYCGDIDELALENFYNLLERNEEIRRQTQDFTELECTKIIAVIDKKYINLNDSHYKILGNRGDSLVLEFDYDETLKVFINMLISNNIDAVLYQIGYDEVSFDEEDRIDVGEILPLINEYL